MIESLDDESCVIDSIELRMLLHDTLEISQSLVSFSDAYYIVDIGDLFKIFGIESDRSTMDLVHAHVGTDSREIDEGIEFWTVPSFPEYPSCPYYHLDFSFLELLGDSEDGLFWCKYLHSVFESPDPLT
jgi:hypothetical protein